MKRRLNLLVLACLCAVVFAPAALLPPAASAQGAEPALFINQLDASTYPTLRAMVTVLDARGVPVTGLASAQFRAFDEGAQIRVSSASSATDGGIAANIVLTIDTSSGMEGAPLEAAQAAAIEFVEGLAPGDRAALIAFNGAVTPIVALTDDRGALIDAIAGLTAAGDTSLFEAVQVSSFIASAAATGGNRAAVVLLSESENDNSTSQATAETSLAAADGAGVPVYVIAFDDLADRAYLQSLSDTTSGAIREATPGSISDVFAELSALLRSQHLLTIEAEGAADGSSGALRIVASVDGQEASATATFARGIAAPPPGSGGVSGATASPGAGSSIWLYAAGALVVLGALGGGAFAGRRWLRQRQEFAHQMAVVAPNRQLAAAQGVPRRVGVMTAGPAVAVAATPHTGTGTLVERGGQERTVAIGAGPLVIGTSPKRCQLVLADHGAIAPEHARIWLRGNRYVLHHVGGMSRKTLVGGQEADWVVLDDGDEIMIGGWRFVFEAS